jgi:hypothetical protein
MTSNTQVILLFFICCLFPLVSVQNTVFLSENSNSNETSSVRRTIRQEINTMRLDESVFVGRCNDHWSRLTIKVAYLQNITHLENDVSERYSLNYRSNKNNQTRHLGWISSHENSTTRTILDTFYSHQLDIVKDQISVCQLDYMRFGHCDVISIEVNEIGNCTARVYSLLSNFSPVPYIYLLSGILIVVAIFIKFIQMFFNKYRHI